MTLSNFIWLSLYVFSVHTSLLLLDSNNNSVRKRERELEDKGNGWRRGTLREGRLQVLTICTWRGQEVDSKILRRHP